ncbi:nuclear transport factor 2 family protein [Bacteroidota bacterium]
MKKLIPFFLQIIVLSSIVMAQNNEEKQNITNCALDYIEGWYEGNPNRMANALHLDLAKRIVNTIPETGKSKLNHINAETLIGYTKKGFGRKVPKTERQKDVTILDIYRNVASVKIVARDWIDYLHLAKCDGDWKIINVLWEMKK